MSYMSISLTFLLYLLITPTLAFVRKYANPFFPPSHGWDEAPCPEWWGNQTCVEQRPHFSYPEPATCECTFHPFWMSFNISGSYSYWDHWRLGADNGGQGLLDNLRGCGVVTDWWFTDLKGNDTFWDWQATGSLPFTIQECVPSAMRGAGAPATPWACRYHWVGWDGIPPEMPHA